MNGVRGKTDWAFAHASAIGTSHVRAGTPCQDAAICELVPDLNGEAVLLVAVSDGAGSAQRSDEGAQFVCEHFRDTVRRWVLGNDLATISFDAVSEAVSLCRLSLQSRAENHGIGLREYACTLLLAIIGAKHAAFLQIGDGAIVASARDKPDVFYPCFWPQTGEYANTTNFITDDDVAASLRFELEEIAVDEIAVFSDGIQSLVLDYAKQTAHGPFFELVLSTIRRESVRGYLDTLSTDLSKFLGSDRVNSRTDDDKTLVLASRRRDCQAATNPVGNAP